MEAGQGARVFQAANVNADNAGLVTVLAALTLVVETAAVQVSAGQQGFVQAFVNGTKGATAGDVQGSFSLGSGTTTATIQFGSANFISSGILFPAVPIGNTVWLPLSGFFTVVTAGLLSIRIRCSSQGSNMTVAANSGNIAMWLFGA